MDNINFIEDRLEISSSKHGLVWFKRRPRLFSAYDREMKVRLRLGSKWEYVNVDDVVRWPDENKDSA